MSEFDNFEAKPVLSETLVLQFLRSRWADVHELELVKGGSWSAAYRFVGDGRALIARFGEHMDDYRRDALAATWRSEILPIPEMVLLGSTTGPLAAVAPYVAVTERLPGQPIESLSADRMNRASKSLFERLATLACVEVPGSGFGSVMDQMGNGEHRSWVGAVLAASERDESRLPGWRAAVAAHERAAAATRRAQQYLNDVAHVLPERRQIIHGDLTYNNVFVDDGDQVSAIFDWGCAMVGDGAYEAARLIFWSPWDIKVDKQLIVDFAEQTYGAENLATRLCAYQAHVGICELQYQGFTGTIDMTPTANRLNELLDQNVE